MHSWTHSLDSGSFLLGHADNLGTGWNSTTLAIFTFFSSTQTGEDLQKHVGVLCQLLRQSWV